MSYETLLYTTHGPIATITLNRPDTLNTIVPPMPDEVQASVEEAVRDDNVKVIVLRGAGRSFCAGYDFGEGFHHWDEAINTNGRWDPGKDFVMATTPAISPTQKLFSIWRSPKPVIAQVHGWCVGGGSDFALGADIVIASEDARIGTPYARMWGAYLSGMWIYRLGLARAKWHGLTGRPLSGREAADVELINFAVPFERLEEEVWKVARELASVPLIAAGGDEAGDQPCVREHGRGIDPDPRTHPRRPDAQHPGRRGVHRSRGTRGCARRCHRKRRPVRRLQPGSGGGQAGPGERDPGEEPPGLTNRSHWRSPIGTCHCPGGQNKDTSPGGLKKCP